MPLAEHLLQRHCQASDRPLVQLSDKAKARLTQYSWPGNVRELDNVMQRALIICHGEQIDADDIMLEQAELCNDASVAGHHEPDTDEATSSASLFDDNIVSNGFKHSVHEQEHRIILATMKACANRRKEVAEKLGISDRTLRYKLARMREAGIELPA